MPTGQQERWDPRGRAPRGWKPRSSPHPCQALRDTSIAWPQTVLRPLWASIPQGGAGDYVIVPAHRSGDGGGGLG